MGATALGPHLITIYDITINYIKWLTDYFRAGVARLARPSQASRLPVRP